VRRQRQRVIGLERVHTRDAHDRRTRGSQEVVHRPAVSEIDDAGTMPSHFESSRDVLQSERFDAEERTETEAIVSRYRSQQQDVH
jgi:hypothetical protein